MVQTTIVRRETSIDPLFSAARVIWTLLGIIEAVLGLRFLLKLVAANPTAGFTDFIYSISSPLVEPFINIARNSSAGNGGVIEWFTIIAAIVYWLVAWAIIGLLTADWGRETRIERL